MMGLVHLRVRIQAWINHDPVDEIIHDGGDAVDTAEALIKAGRILSSHRLLLLRHAGKAIFELDTFTRRAAMANPGLAHRWCSRSIPIGSRIMMSHTWGSPAGRS